MIFRGLCSKLKGKVISLLKKGAGHVFLGSFAIKFITFFGSVFIVRILTKTEYGVLSYYENILGYFCILSGFGLAAGIQRYLILANKKEEKKGCYRYALLNGNIWNLLLCALCLFFCFFYKHPDSFQGYPIVVVFLTLCIPFIFTSNLTLNAFRSLFDYKGYAYLAVILAFVSVLARIIGAATGGLEYSVLGRFVAEIFGAIVCVAFLYIIHFKKISSIQPDKAFIRGFNNYSVQLMLTDGLWTIFMLNDILLLGQLSGSDSLLADYKIAYVIPANFSIITASICTFTTPYFTQKDKDGDKQWVSTKLKETLLVSMAAIGCLALLCYAFSGPIITILFGSQYLSAKPIMSILLIASFFNNGIRMVVANTLSAIGQQTTNLIVAGIGIVIQIILDIVLIPQYGAIGVGFSSIIVYFLMSVMLLIVVRDKIFININSCKK